MWYKWRHICTAIKVNCTLHGWTMSLQVSQMGLAMIGIFWQNIYFNYLKKWLICTTFAKKLWSNIFSQLLLSCCHLIWELQCANFCLSHFLQYTTYMFLHLKPDFMSFILHLQDKAFDVSIYPSATIILLLTSFWRLCVLYIEYVSL